MDPKKREKLLMKPRYKFFSCGNCGQRQLKAAHCRFCGAPKRKTDVTSDYQSDAELIMAVDAAANDGVSKEARKSGLYCSSCDTHIAANEDFCSACGHPADASDEAVSVKRRSSRGDMVEVENDGRRFPEMPSIPSISSRLPVSFRPAPTTSSASNHTAETAQDKLMQFFSSRLGIGVIAGFVIFVLWAIFWPFTAPANLVSTQFQPSVEVAYIEIQTGLCWENIDCPSGYVEVSRSLQDYTPPGEVVVSTITVNESDYGDVQVGTRMITQVVEHITYGDPGPDYHCEENDEEIDDVIYPGVCTPVPEATYSYTYPETEEAVYGTKTPYPHNQDVMGTKTPHPENRISYTLDVHKKRWHTFDWIASEYVYIPELVLNPALRESLTGQTKVDFRVLYDYKDVRHTAGVNENEWKEYVSLTGQPVEVRVNIFGWLLGLKK